MKFLIKHALTGGFGGCEREDGEIIDVENEEVATNYAWEMACGEYDMYDGRPLGQSIHTLREASITRPSLRVYP